VNWLKTGKRKVYSFEESNYNHPGCELQISCEKDLVIIRGELQVWQSISSFRIDI